MNLKRCCLVLLCGIPGAGKSTLASSLVDYFKDGNLNQFKIHLITVSYDQLLPDNFIFHQDMDKLVQSWKEHRNDVIDMVKICLERLRDEYYPVKEESTTKYPTSLILNNLTTCKCMDASTFSAEAVCSVEPISPDHLFIVDDNMFYRSMRYSYYQLARDYSVGFCQVFLKCSETVAWRRNAERKEPVAAKSFNEITKKFEEPDGEKYSWESSSYVIDSDVKISDSELGSLSGFILQQLDSPFLSQPIESSNDKAAAQVVTASNLFHQVDQVLRNHISECIKECKGSSKSDRSRVKELAKALSEKKKSFLIDLRGKATLQVELRRLSPLTNHISEQSEDFHKTPNLTRTSPSSNEFSSRVLLLFNDFSR